MPTGAATALRTRLPVGFAFLPRNARSYLAEHTMIARARLRRSAPVAIYGLQRSGTNYLLQVLLTLEVTVINRVEPDRDNPRNKHFRWQADKDTIPTAIKSQYGNTRLIKNFYDLCLATRRPKDSRHIVIFKEKERWLASVLNWGLRCGWFESKGKALSQIDAFAADYDAYWAFWSKLADEAPQNVTIVHYEAIMENFEYLKDILTSSGITFSNNGFDGNFREVPMSPGNTPRPISVEDVRQQRSQGE